MKNQIFKAAFAGISLVVGILLTKAQTPATPTLNFTVPDTVTVGQSFSIVNTSTAIPTGTTFTWNIEDKAERQFQAKDTLISIVTSSATFISYAYLHEGAFKITLNATGINEFQKTIWVKGLINSNCSQYLQNYNYVDCENVANGSFEDYTALATNTYNPSIKNFCPWRFNPWIYSLGSADQYHQNNNAQILSVPVNGAGYQQAASGGGYAGLLTYTSGGHREYFFANLKEPLQPGEQYNVRFKVSLAEGSSHSTKVSACLVNSPSQTTQNFPGTQQNNIITINPNRCITSNVVTDKNGWTEVSGIFNASNALPENTIIIGHFNFTGQTPTVSPVNANPAYPAITQELGTAAYYYIDDISVKSVGYCHCPADKSFGTDLNSVTYTSQLNMSPGQSASIIGNLVVNSPQYTMSNLNLKFAPGSKVTVPQGTKLQIVQGSVLESCTEMWEGIFAQGEILLYQSTVRDAKSALNFTNGSQWNVQQAILENNRRHMFVNCPQVPGSFQNEIFRYNILRCNPAAMKPPFVGQYTYNAVEINNVRSVYIGKSYPPAERNHISDAVRGIYAEKALAIYVQNNHFENIGCHGMPCSQFPDLGVAVVVNAQKITEPMSTLYAGINGNQNGRNTFTHCRGGIYSFGNVNTQAYMNQMSYITDYGIYGRDNNRKNNGLIALNNQISHAKTGIYAYNAGNRPVMIFGNTVNKLMDFNTVPTYGIRVENPLASSQPYAVFVNGNTVWKYRFGIHLSQITTPQVMNNLVNTDAQITSYPEGIRVNYCPKAQIAENDIAEYGYGLGQSIGIRVEYSPGMSVICNNTYSNHIALFFGAQQEGSTVGANYMHNGRQGIYINYGNIGPQGPGKDPHMNAWIGNTWQSHFHNYGTLNSTFHGNYSPFNLKYNGTIFWPNPLLRTRNHVTVPLIPTMPVQNNNPVPAFVTNCRGNLDNPDGMVLQLFNDTVTYPDSTLYKEEIEWCRELLLYRAVKEDTTGMLDAALYQYKAALELTATGRLDASKDSALTGNYAYAATTLSAVTAEKEVEQKLKEVYAGTFAFLADTSENKRPAETDSLLLYQLAGECPYRFGEAVYTARNVIMAFNPDTLFINVCEDVDWMLDKSGSINSETEPLARATVYPNPSADDFVVRFESIADAQDAEVTVTDIYGRERGRYYIYRGADMVLIPGAGLEKGVYICTIKIKGETVESIKITKQ